MNFKGKAKRLDDIDLPLIGKNIGVGEDEIHAVIDVESAGGGFDREGRPKMLFEPHVFYRQLSAVQLSKAVKLGVAYPKWGEKPYPRDSYLTLGVAMGVNATAALKSASWGMGQIMGYHYGILGYPTVQAMVQAFADDEEAQLRGMIRFIQVNHLDDELRAHNWAAFARGYNGAGYAKHSYHIKLEAAYRKWAGIRDTKLPERQPHIPAPNAPPPAQKPPVAPPVAPQPIPSQVPAPRSLWQALAALFAWLFGKAK